MFSSSGDSRNSQSNKEGFVHSVKVPTQYRRIASVLKAALERKKSLKSLIFEERHVRMRGMQGVLKQYVDNRSAIDEAIAKTKILEENPRLCPVLCKVLVTELIFGRKQIIGESKPVQTVRCFREKFLEVLGDTTSAVPKKKDQKFRYVRVNTNLLSVPEAIKCLDSEGWRKKECAPFESYSDYLSALSNLGEDEYVVDMHLSDLLVFSAKHKHYWACHDLVKQMQFLLQDKGTSLVAELLQPPTGAIVLDMCAAPGMKTIHASNVMQNKGTIYAIEQNHDRYKVLCRMTEAAGCSDIVKTIEADALTIDETMCPNVEYIMVDPPCSGSGMQNRMSLDPDEKDPERLKKLSGLQVKMLSHAMRTFPSVKRICYSTCSLYEEENEQVVQDSLRQNPDFKLLSCKKALRNKWINVGDPKYKKIGKNCIYAIPDKDFTDGIFIAIFERRRDVDGDDQ